MMGVACRFDPKQHVVIRSCVADSIGRGAPTRVRGSLFLYRHRVTGCYVLGQWTGPDRRMFMDVLNMGPFLSGVGRVRDIVGRMYEYNPVPLWKEMGQKRRSMLSQQQDESNEDADWRIWREGRERLGKVQVALTG